MFLVFIQLKHSCSYMLLCIYNFIDIITLTQLHLDFFTFFNCGILSLNHIVTHMKEQIRGFNNISSAVETLIVETSGGLLRLENALQLLPEDSYNRFMDIHVFPMTICETFLKINKVIKLFVLKILCLKAPNPHVRPVAAADSVYAMIRVCLQINFLSE